MRVLLPLLLILGLTACSDDGKPPVKTDNPGGSTTGDNTQVVKGALPYSLSDSVLLRMADTAQLRDAAYPHLLPESLRMSLGGSRLRFFPIAEFAATGGSFQAVRVSSGSRDAALLYRREGSVPVAVIPFLVADADPATQQTSSIDRAGAVTRTVLRKGPKDQTAEGREVYMYDAASKTFVLIGANPIENEDKVINPIDTLKRTHPLAGDYIKDSRNYVSVRDARSPGEVQLFIHFEKGEDDDPCVGELKGNALLTSSKTAVYREGGNPCILELSFSGNNVSLREAAGCGTFRGVKCLFEGSYTRKKPASPKTAVKKKTGK